MQYDARCPSEYLDQLPEDRKNVITQLRDIFLKNLPEGFEETVSYGILSFVVPYSIYPEGYHANPKEPLPFIALASQKNHIAVYHMGLGFFPEVLEWFSNEYPKYVKTKLDMGKSCIRFKNMKAIPYLLLAELCQKITLEDYVKKYKKAITS